MSQNQLQFTVSVVIERQVKTVGRWSVNQWELTGILSAPEGPDRMEGPVELRQTKNHSQYMWQGLKIKLFADASEGYWYNLLSETPYAFVLFEHDSEDDEDIPSPILVTVNQDEASGHLEADNLVLSSPLPTDIRDEVEKFVVDNYVPETRKKRKRRNWFQESEPQHDEI